MRERQSADWPPPGSVWVALWLLRHLSRLTAASVAGRLTASCCGATCGLIYAVPPTHNDSHCTPYAHTTDRAATITINTSTTTTREVGQLAALWLAGCG